MINVDGNMVSITGLDEFEARLKRLKTDSPGFERRLRGAIKKILGEARANLRKDAADGLQMKSDPRHAYKAVRFAVYKRIFGGQVNILSKKTAGAPSSYKPQRTLQPKQRGGNRRQKNSRNMDIYEGADRGFILRFLNAGTDDREIKFASDDRRERVNRGSRGGNLQKYGKTINTGYRGKIGARNWFGQASQAELEKVAGHMQNLIDRIIEDEFI